MPSSVDVLVVGAGAADLAAGLALAAAGVTFKVIEARDRIGGRAWTDCQTFPGRLDRSRSTRSCWIGPLTALGIAMPT